MREISNNNRLGC